MFFFVVCGAFCIYKRLNEIWERFVAILSKNQLNRKQFGKCSTRRIEKLWTIYANLGYYQLRLCKVDETLPRVRT